MTPPAIRVFSLSGSTILLLMGASVAFNACPFASRHLCRKNTVHRPASLLYSSFSENDKDDLSSANLINVKPDDSDTKDDEPSLAAATNTINERLLEELKEATKEEKGPKSSFGKKLGLDAFRSEKSEEEREAAIAEARDLNGVNPVVALAGSGFALAVAGGLWALTNLLVEFFVLHPVESDAYVVERATAVMRNVIIAIVSLASGFFGVTGLGIFLLGVRVAYGVATGELDPTPIKKSKQEEIEMPNVWDLMMNKKPGRRR
jgi:hypothetical protein